MHHALSPSAAWPMAFLLYRVQGFKEVELGEDPAPGEQVMVRSLFEISGPQLLAVPM